MRTGLLAIAGSFVILAHFGSATGSSLTPLLRESSLPPMGHTFFCHRYPQDCVTNTPSSRFLLQSAKNLYSELDRVHRRVNISIASVVTTARKRPDIEPWRLSPLTGNCNDFAVTKRHELLRRGWPSWALLLAEVTLKTGEHHLILVANLRGESLILDNLEVGPVWLSKTDYYRWNRIQSTDNTKLWLNMSSSGRPTGDGTTALQSSNRP